MVSYPWGQDTRGGGGGGGGGVCSLANYSVAYVETQSNRVSDFRDFVCSLFPKAILFMPPPIRKIAEGH